MLELTLERTGVGRHVLASWRLRTLSSGVQCIQMSTCPALGRVRRSVELVGAVVVLDIVQGGRLLSWTFAGVRCL